MRWIALLMIGLVLQGCANGNSRPFSIKSLAKSDIDMVTDAHIKALNSLVRELTIKLYKRNPRELRKGPPGMTVSRRLHLLLDSPRMLNFPELGSRYGVDAVPLAFDPNFKGDRVFALMVGISGMLFASYGYKNEFYLLDEIDQQKLYNSARNLEAIDWRLNNRRQPNGQLYLLSNGISPNGVPNFSFERIFGQMIAYQDMMARIVSDQTNRTIKAVVVGFASTTLLPI